MGLTLPLRVKIGETQQLPGVKELTVEREGSETSM